MKRRVVLDFCVLSTLIMCIGFLISSTNAKAEDIYAYIDEDGIIVLTNCPIPDKYLKIAKKIESYQRDSPEEIQRYQAGEKAKEQRAEAELRQKQQINRAQEEAQKQNNRQQAQQIEQQKRQSENQDVRNRMADKIEAEAGRLSPGRRAEALTNAERIRSGQETVSNIPERTVNTPPPVDNSPKWGTVYDQKTRRNVEGWTQP